jgi:hypothetical protein
MVGLRRPTWIRDLMMTDEMMAMRGAGREDPDTDLLREMIGFAVERLMRVGMWTVDRRRQGQNERRTAGPA